MRAKFFIIIAVTLVLLATSSVFATSKTFEFPEIPPKIVWHGSSYDFSFSWAEHEGAVFSFTCDSAPAGDLTLTTGPSDTWVMSYTPDVTDTAPFMVTLTGETVSGIRRQTFELIPTAHLPYEQAIFDIANHLGPGSFESDDIIEHVTGGSYLSINNQTSKLLKKVSLLGKTIVWENANDLYNKYNGKLDQQEIVMTADTVIIKCPLHFPQTNVIINARLLKFDGPGSKITTTPNVTYIRSTNPAASYKGWPAGNIELNIESFEKTYGGEKFDLRGSKGQDGCLGAHGDDGHSIPWGAYWSGVTDSTPYQPNYWNAPAGEYIIYYERWSWDFFGIPIEGPRQPATGNPENPTSGTDATSPGRPGTGGNGGVFKTTLNTAGPANIAGGSGGDTPSDAIGIGGGEVGYKGGAAGTPKKWVKVRHDFSLLVFLNNWYITDSYATLGYATPDGTEKGDNKSILYPHSSTNGYVAYPGNMSHPWDGNPFAWMDPIVMGGFFNDAKDLYLSGDLTGAKERIEYLSATIAGYKDSAHWAGNTSENQRFELSQMYDHMEALLYQIENRLDYFGHPAGWVPMLSFEVNLNLFDSEIDRSIEQLYLAHWVGRQAASSGQKLSSITELRKKLQEDIDDAYEDFETAKASLPGLRIRAENVKASTEARIGDLQAYEYKLSIEADRNLAEPWWKTGLKMAGMVVKQIPFIQPLGEAFYIAADFDTEDPYGEALKITSVADQFVASAIEDTAAGVSIAANAATGKEGVAIKEAIQMIGNEMPNMTEYVTDAVDVVSGLQAPVDEIWVEIERLKALDPNFAIIAEDIEELVEEQLKLRSDLAEAMLAMTMNVNIIRESLLAMDALQDEVASLSVPDDRALQYLELIERRAFDRLLKYHYYVAKSYEYRLLEEYTEPLDLQDLFYELSNNTQAGTGNQVIPADQFASLKAIYTDIISTIVNKIATEYNENGVSTSAAPLRFNLTADELDLLNNGKTVTLNLMDIPDAFPLYEENARILDIAVYDIQTTPLGGVYEDNAYVDIHIQHEGLSKLIKDGETFLFQHFVDDSTNPFKWGAWYYANDDDILPVTPSPSNVSLIHSILSTGGNATPENLMLYSRPSVWSDYTITMSVYGNAGRDIQLDSLRLEVLHDFERQDNIASIRTKFASIDSVDGSVNMDAGFLAYINVDTADLAGRQNGRGSLYRSYYSSSQNSVEISTQRRYAGWKFWRWADEYGNPLTTGRVLSIVPDDHKVVTAQYVSIYDLAGDLNYDCRVDMQDILMIAKSWELAHGQLNLDDGDTEGMVNIAELAAISNNWLKTCDDIFITSPANSPLAAPQRIQQVEESGNVLVPGSERQLEFVYE